MASPFSSPQFLRLVGKPLLREYFHQKGLLPDVDFEQLGDTEIAPIQAAIQGLPGETRVVVDSDFNDVHDLGSATCQVAIVQAARSRGVAFPDEFGSIRDTHEQASCAASASIRNDFLRVMGHLAMPDCFRTSARD